MENLVIEKAKATPRIAFDATTGVLEMEGDSYPENAMHFYQPVLEWLSRFLSSSSTPVTFNFRLDYFNTSSSKCIITILEMVENAVKSGRTVTMNWHYYEDDDDMKEHGEEFAEDFSIPFKFVAIPS
ncbi:MAG: hypothetical protein CFK52_06370 [Chloracidobacterium sp. CP2_5A]|nr:MAG: hypothetical protein CFK52_06370 [Chloracidobacterium sp. CP2_5A]